MALEDEYTKKYIEFETAIKKRNNIEKYDTRTDYIKIDKILSKNYNLWSMYRDLRNLLSHEHRVRNLNYLVVSQECYNAFVKDVEKVLHPKKAFNIAHSPVVTANADSIISEVISNMLENNYTCTPIVNDKGVLLGVFSPHSLMLYFEFNKKELLAEAPQHTSISEIMQFCGIDNDQDVEYKFIQKDMDEFEIKSLFEESYSKNKRLEALFVTEHGKANEKILGIITNWDIINNN